MNYLEEIKRITDSESAIELQKVQELWSSYGKITRVKLRGSEYLSVIAKHIVLPKKINHPRGWGSAHSHKRKIQSYHIEDYWYKHYSNKTDRYCKVPKLIGSFSKNNELLIVLEDLDALGYNQRRNRLNFNEVKLCLDWLANFHAKFLGTKPKELWAVGTYWHFKTRPDEFEAMEDGELKSNADKIDKLLNKAKYQTLVHGDAKVANFCFNKDMTEVAAVDFQYVGGGVGIKDVAYLLSSCMTEDESELYDEELLNYYFFKLEKALGKTRNKIAFNELKVEWTELYSYAWADFIRFMMGWMPTHKKLNSYSKKQVDIALKLIG